MGTWGIKIFEDDITMDVRDYFNDYVNKGDSISKATDKILHLLKDEIKDKDEGPLIYFSLAELQMEKGILEINIKEKCLECLKNGTSMDRWISSGISQFLKRRKVLKEFIARLKKFSNVVDKSNPNTEDIESVPLEYTVYVLEDNNSQTKYVGKTSCFEKRKQYMENLFKNYRSKVIEQ